MRKALKWTGIALLTPVVLMVILAALLYLPPIQNWVVQRVATYASEQTGMDISVERVRLAFPLDLSLEGVRVLQPASDSPSTLHPSPSTVYTLDGIRQQQARRGLNIIDGQLRVVE